MMHKPKAIFSWSGGKDSSYALYKVLQENTYEVMYLLTTVNQQVKRISMHGVRELLLQQQAESIGIPLITLEIHEDSNAHYEQQMSEVLTRAKSEGINCVIFGDIFLENLRQYREDNMAKIHMKAVFPLWKRDTTELLTDFLTLGFKTITCCVNDGYLPEEWVGREIDEHFLKELPLNVDACGENGEYHTFCYAGPLFKKRIAFTVGEKVYKPLVLNPSATEAFPETNTKGFWFIDLLPAQGLH